MKATVTNVRPTGHNLVRASTLLDWVPAGRRLVLVDIENLVGGSATSFADVSDAVDRLRRAIAPSMDDVWTIACGLRRTSARSRRTRGAYRRISRLRVHRGRPLSGRKISLAYKAEPCPMSPEKSSPNTSLPSALRPLNITEITNSSSPKRPK